MSQDQYREQSQPYEGKQKNKQYPTGPKRDLNMPKGMDDILDEIDEEIRGSDLANKFKQTGGQ